MTILDSAFILVVHAVSSSVFIFVKDGFEWVLIDQGTINLVELKQSRSICSPRVTMKEERQAVSGNKRPLGK